MNSMPRWYARSAGVSLCLLASCLSEAPQPRAELMLVLRTDLAPPKDFDEVELELSSFGHIHFDRVYSAGTSELSFPATLGITSRDKNAPVAIRITGRLQNRARYLREVVTTVPVGRAATLTVNIEWLCLDQVTTGADGKVLSQCGRGKTCVGGECVDVSVEASKLPDYVPTEVFGGKGSQDQATCFDTIGCFSSGVTADVDIETCTVSGVPAPDDGHGVSLAIVQPPGSDGICGPEACLVPLDFGTPGGWSKQDGRPVLPPAVCARIGEGHLLGVAATAACTQKTASLPTCGEWSSIKASPGTFDAPAPEGVDILFDGGDGGAGLEPDNPTIGGTDSGGAGGGGGVAGVEQEGGMSSASGGNAAGAAGTAGSGAQELGGYAGRWGGSAGLEGELHLGGADSGGGPVAGASGAQAGTLGAGGRPIGAGATDSAGAAVMAGGGSGAIPPVEAGQAGEAGTSGSGAPGTGGGAGVAGVVAAGAAAGVAGAAGAAGVAGAAAGNAGASGSAALAGAAGTTDLPCGPGATRTCLEGGLSGPCATGEQLCGPEGTWNACSIPPAEADTCDQGNDANCNGRPNEGCGCLNDASQSCGDTVDVGICHLGTSTCSEGSWGECMDVSYPQERNCASTQDNNCDGVSDELETDYCVCTLTQTRLCGSHPEDGVGICHSGLEGCTLGPGNTTSDWSGSCEDSVGPSTEICSGGEDEDCDGLVDAEDIEDCTPSISSPPLVALPEGYSIDGTEVTRSQYASWLATSPSTAGQIDDCTWNAAYSPDSACMASTYVCQGDGCGNHPQPCVDWCDAYAFCNAVGKRLCGSISGGSTPYTSYADYAVSQWYNACTSHGARTEAGYPYDELYQAQTCNGSEYTGTDNMTADVGALGGCQAAGAYGSIWDLSGNLYEWEDSCNGPGATANCRVRGGSFFSASSALRCSGISSGTRNGAYDSIGFRCCSP